MDGDSAAGCERTEKKGSGGVGAQWFVGSKGKEGERRICKGKLYIAIKQGALLSGGEPVNRAERLVESTITDKSFGIAVRTGMQRAT
jgi:hypothetical protein